MDSDGKGEIEITLDEMAKMITPSACGKQQCVADNLPQFRFPISVTVHEDATGIEISETDMISIEAKTIRMTVMSITPSSYKVGLPFRGFVSIEAVQKCIIL